MPRPWLPLYPADYLADTRDLDATEHGVYLLLLMESWDRGPLPDDLGRLCRLAAGAPAQCVRCVLERYWRRDEAGWTNTRLEEERTAAEEKYQAKVARVTAARQARLQASNQPLISELKSEVKSDLQSGSKATVQLTTHILPTEDQDLVPNGTYPTGSPEGSPAGMSQVPYHAILDLYHRLLTPPLARVTRLNTERKRHISARWHAELPDLETWEAYFRAVARSRLPKGWLYNGTPWKPGLDYLLREKTLTAIEEGKYDP